MQSLVESHVFREFYRESMRLVLSKWWSSSLQRIRFLLVGRQEVPIAHFRPITALVGHVVFRNAPFLSQRPAHLREA